MKYLIFIICIFFKYTSFSQETNYKIGLTYQPFHYESYNKVDWNNRPYSYPDNSKSFNGYAIGIVIEKNLNNYISFASELSYSQQTQKHISSNYSGGGGINSPFNINLNTDFTFIKLPFLINFQYQLGYESTYYLEVGTGIQLSYLLDYYSVETVYGVGNFTNAINYNFYSAKYIDSRKISEYYFWEENRTPPQYLHIIQPSPSYIFKYWHWGAICEIKIKKIFFDNYILSLGARYEYDFTNSEANKSPIDSHRYFKGKKPKTHNIREVLNISFLYIFD